MKKTENIKLYSEAVINGETRKALSIIPEILPSKLYHYTSFSEYWHSKIIQGQLFLSNPASFNDPYDCRIQGNTEFWVRQYLENHPVDDPEKVLDNFLNGTIQITYNGKQMPLKDYADVACTEFKAQFRIACLSECKDSMLMWSHYAAMHSGYAIELDARKIYENPYDRIHLRKVVYDKRPITNEALIKSTSKEAFLLCKAPAWKYEKEWRYFEMDGCFWNVSDYISAVYLGSRFNFSSYYFEVKAIQAYCKENGIKLFQMKIDDATYKLYAVEITDTVFT